MNLAEDNQKTRERFMDDSVRVLFVRPRGGKFVDIDKDIFAKHFRLKVVNAVWREKGPLSIVLVPFRILRGTLRAEVTFTWFVGAHAFFMVLWSRLLGKKSIVVMAGYEVLRVTGNRYGLSSGGLFARMARFTLNNANLILAVDDSLRIKAIENIGAIGSNIRTVPTGYDSNEFRPAGTKENLALTVGISRNLWRNRFKGIDFFAECARSLPDLDFLVIGVEDEAFQDLAKRNIGNLRLLGPLPQSELLTYLQKAKIYCQFSLHEGLPNSLCEAMLCECVPVGTKICGIPIAIGDTGFYAEVGDVKTAVEAIKKALASNNGAAARERIRALFPRERREREIVQAVKDVMKD